MHNVEFMPIFPPVYLKETKSPIVIKLGYWTWKEKMLGDAILNKNIRTSCDVGFYPCTQQMY
jgi:hypothetical protein